MASAVPSFPEAARVVYDYASNLLACHPRTERLALDSTYGCILAQPVRADRDMPAFQRSTRDGFAVRAAEASAHKWLQVAGSIRAGEPPAGPLPTASAWEIMTGAAVPEGADAVAMLEHVEQDGKKVRLIKGRTLDPGENVVPAAAEAHAGEELIPTGTRLGPSQIAAAATCGYAHLEVFVRPRVAILTTGDELVPVDTTPGSSQIRNSNASMLAALVAQNGGEPWILPAAKDNTAALGSALRKGIEADMLLISGGVSAGKFDLVEPVLASLGAHFHFTGVRIQPGKPLVFGEIPRAKSPLAFFGLPGNPISSAATFLLFGSAVLRALAGNHLLAPLFSAAQLSRDAKGKPNLTRFIPAAFKSDPLSCHLPEVAPVPWQGSGDLAAFARANCFIFVPEGIDRIPAGDIARILPI
ncbi:molybdopterin molybdotransferase MoeA [Occallatibacter riparius]|uniref:Molybdopterin molybdenumtransferase n=1 Tax=Occallatibacter riparius TaxID=1002689 RepID=A0A9J7BPB7_9BACT|nr:gephyrin-like molybdotransferase Glp [Occallatibacter riparius]UWZ84595.1 molybdopterin molybdotransferase MoeA [Occallatibacter riparius]